MLLSKHVLDPQLYHLQQCIRTCRNMLAQAPSHLQQQFFRCASRHNRRHTDVWGPAGALSYHLAQIGWAVLPDGTLDTDSVVQFHLLHTPRKCIFQYLEHAWMRHLTQCELHRPEWTSLPTPNRQATLRAYANSDPVSHRTTAAVLTGTSMLAGQIKHFADTTENCELCGQHDTYLHRALHCTSTADVRYRYQDLIDEVEALNPSFVHLPVVTLSPELDFQRWYFDNRPTASVTPELASAVQHASDSDEPIEVYTDGSCTYPNLPTCRRASFAVVLLADRDQTRHRMELARYIATSEIPSSFHVGCLGEVRGTQNIPRAELQAALRVAQLQCPTVLWTDSSYVISTVTLLQSTTEVCLLHNCNNYDVLRDLWPLVQRDNFMVRKVKAHALKPTEDSFEVTWTKLGNHAADIAAKQYLAHLQHTYPLDLDGEQLQTQMTRCRLWYRYMHDLQVNRAILFQQDLPEEPLGDRTQPWHQQFTSLRAWRPARVWQFLYTQQYDHLLDTYVWGSTYADALLQWLSLLQWPQEGFLDPHGNGVTWYELALSFIMTTQYGIMVNGGGQHSSFRPVLQPPGSREVPWNSQVKSFEKAIQALQKLVDAQLHSEDRCMANSIRILGASHKKHGLASRPWFPHQDTIVEAIRSHMDTFRNAQTFDHCPTVPEVSPLVQLRTFYIDDEDERLGWDRRVQRHRRRHRQE
eukprot:Skav209651  [mRNA]  locus=scaffold650:128702:130789:+ [translate_table: standard]